jgi:rRNA maturation protein Nop10
MSHYLRTCTACGREWTVTPAAARGGRLAAVLARLRGRHADADPEEAAYAAKADPRNPLPTHTPGSAREALRHCPRCGGSTYTERRRAGPAD